MHQRRRTRTITDSQRDIILDALEVAEERFKKHVKTLSEGPRSLTNPMRGTAEQFRRRAMEVNVVRALIEEAVKITLLEKVG